MKSTHILFVSQCFCRCFNYKNNKNNEKVRVERTNKLGSNSIFYLLSLFRLIFLEKKKKNPSGFQFGFACLFYSREEKLFKRVKLEFIIAIPT